jgi:hypothetical protein
MYIYQTKVFERRKKTEERREVGRISVSSYYSPNFIEDLPRPLSKQYIM